MLSITYSNNTLLIQSSTHNCQLLLLLLTLISSNTKLFVTAIISSLPNITVVNYSPTMQKKLMAKSLFTPGADAFGKYVGG